MMRILLKAGPKLADMSRCCHLLQQGQFVADLCAYYADNAPNLVPARRIAPTIKSQWARRILRALRTAQAGEFEFA